ncbi:MAG TPA: hypothetical protein DCL44_08260 [Elusimicrobia bacterium]|nr:hypothetical protein [Elusimicrobiota bacterium]
MGFSPLTKIPPAPYTIGMKLLKTLSKISLAAIALPLFSSLGVRAADLAFDSGSTGSGLAGSVQELKAQSANSDIVRAPVPSTITTSNEMTNFWDNLHQDGGTIEKLCKSAQIKLNQNATVADVVGIGGGIKRYLKAYPDQRRLALVDEIEVKLSASFNTEVLAIPNIGTLNIGIGGGVEGKSVVVRPLAEEKYCKELGSLVKLYEMKTVLPINAKRISKMEKGEIWKLPMVVRYNVGVGIGANVNQLVTISIGAGRLKERKPSVSLYRIDDNNLRLRLRLDTVRVMSVGVSAKTVEIPISDIGLMGGTDLISTTINSTANRIIASEINKMIAFKLAYGYARTHGQKMLLEFIINPNDKEQLERLAQFVQGDLDSIRELIKIGVNFKSFSEEASGKEGVGEIERLAAQTGAQLSANATFAGTDHYDGHTHNFNITVPIIHAHQKAWSSTYHRYQALNNDGSTIHVQQETRVSKGDSLNLPLAGTLVKSNSQKDVYVVNKEAASGEVSRPVMLYQQYEGFIRNGDSSARAMIDNANGVLKYAGMQGNGINMDNTLPSAGIFPPLPPEPKDPDADPSISQQDPSKTYKAALMSFKLVFAEKAVQDIIFAPAQIIMKSFMNVMRESEGAIIDKVMDLFTIDKKGRVAYDERAVSKRLGVSASDNNGDQGTNPLDIVRTLASAATGFIEKIVSVRNESGWKAQSERLAKVAATGDMRYEDFLKVVIQMVDVKNISSEIYVHTDKRVKGEADVTQNYNMFNNRDNGFDRTIADVTQMRERFAEPTALTD